MSDKQLDLGNFDLIQIPAGATILKATISRLGTEVDVTEELTAHLEAQG